MGVGMGSEGGGWPACRAFAAAAHDIGHGPHCDHANAERRARKNFSRHM